MDHALGTDMADWQQFARSGFRVRFRYPVLTPRGRPVDCAEEQRDDGVRVHLTSRDSRDVYVEVRQFLGLAPGDEYARHKGYLEQRFGAGATTELTATSLGRWPGWAYAFQWEQGERSVLLLPVLHDTYRIIYDPRSPLNMQVIATIALVE
jgi:hypothetical protein